MSDRALALLAGLRLEDGGYWGDAAAPFQWEDARAVLDVDPATPYHFQTRARGGSKTSDEAGATIAAMLTQLAPGSRGFGVAADEAQARLLVTAIAGFTRRTPELRGALRIDAHRVTAVRSGVTFETLPADAASSWGLLPSWVVIDELAQWPETTGAREVFDAVTSAAAKVSHARLIVLTTAGSPGHWSRSILDHALSAPLWRVHEVPGPPPWLDPARLDEERRRLAPSMFARLFLNQWTSGEDRLVSADDLAAAAVLDGPQDPKRGLRYVIGLDLGLKRDATVAAVCHSEHGVVDLDRLQVWQGSAAQPVTIAEVGEWVAHAARAYNGASVIVDPWQAVGLAQDLRRRGVSVREYPFTSTSVGRLAGTLYRLLREGSLRLPADRDLIDELASVRLRETAPGVLRLDHDAGKHDDRAVAIALAAHRLVERGERPTRHATWASPAKLSVRRAPSPLDAVRVTDTAPVARVVSTLRRHRTAHIVSPGVQHDRLAELARAAGITVRPDLGGDGR